MYKLTIRYYDADGHYIWKYTHLDRSLRANIIRAQNFLQAGRGITWCIHNKEHPNHQMNGGDGLARAVPLLPTNISIKSKQDGKFVSWYNI